MDRKEKRFEQDIENFMLTNGGYTKGSMNNYDATKAMNIHTLISFIKATQPKQWKRYNSIYGSDSEKKLYKRFNDTVNTHGLLYVLRNGLNDRGVRLKVCFFKPETSLNMDSYERYNQNIVECTRQFYYSPVNKNSIDMVLSLNGIPIVAIELKNQLTGQSVENGKAQFMYDRNPKELSFNFNKRFLVYFTADLYNIYMTTKLAGKNTFFLPFNMGSNGAGNVGGAGNPENEKGYATSYLWEEVLTKDSLMNILHKFLHLEVKTESKIINGKKQTKTSRTLIFPRYHQLDVVTKLVNNVKEVGSGKNFLIQHSAGSGKSNSIAWLSYRLASLHDSFDKNIFTSVIIVTDRRVLDSQLQDTISGFDHVEGLVETIDDKKKSVDLRDAINDGKKIIITTLQKFPVIYNEIESNVNKRFAVIVDEAHSSQSGNSASKLKTALSNTEEALKEYAEIENFQEANTEDFEDKIVNELINHGKHNNLSFFAFTATPKEKTLEMFGELQSDGSFTPYHIYSMKQAIEEGFIHDVLKNYMTYNKCYKIAKNTPDNPELNESQAKKAIVRYESLHSYTLAQKTEIMVEQFREITSKKIGGKAKAMIVTSSRLHAVRYFHEFKKYIDLKGYEDLDVLVAFSGTVSDKNNEYTEVGLNINKDGERISEKQLPKAFESDDFNMLIVAEKYQTGFDEPLLHTMFVDKKLKGVKAVQTLSRVNRTTKGKTDTFILDFVNEANEIQEAFAKYYRETTLNEEVNVNLIYDTKIILREHRLYNDLDIDKFNKIFYKGSQSSTDLGKITSLLKPIVDMYMSLDEDSQYEFKKASRNYVKWYSYITQIIRMFDKDLHKEFNFLSYLNKLLPQNPKDKVDLEDKIKLEFYNLKETFSGSISLEETNEGVLENARSIDTGVKTEDVDEFLETIINSINEKFDGQFTEGDRVIVETIYDKVVKDNVKLKEYARKNNSQIYEHSIFPEIFKKVAHECYMEQMDSFTKLFEDKEFYNSVMQSIAKESYREHRNG